MNVVAEQSFEQLPIDCIQASRTNPRRSFDPAGLAELSASIVEMGIQQPCLVRPLLDDEHVEVINAWEIVVGERRWRAAKMAGKQTLPCMVRDMTDEEAREIQIIENLQREDVSPIEEAEAFQAVLEVRGSISAVAARFGKEVSYVAKCLRLNALTLPSRDALRGRLITMDHALLLARLGDAEQNAALKWALDTNAGPKTPVEKVLEYRFAEKAQREKQNGERRYFHYTWEPQSVVKLKAWIEAESGIPLSRAPWSLDDDSLLPDVPACNACPQNTKANAPLFGDLDMGEATCTNGACFQAKTSAFVRIALRQQPINVIAPRLSWKLSSVKPSICPNELKQPGSLPEIANPAKVLKQGQWIEAKKGSCQNVRNGVTMDWSDANDRGYMGGGKQLRKPGELLTVCIAVGCKAHPKAWEKTENASSSKGSGLSYEEQRKIEAVKEQAYVAAEAPIRLAIYRAVKEKVKLDTDGMLRALMLDALTDQRNSCTVEFCEVNGFDFARPSNDLWRWRENARGAIRTELPKASGAALVSMAFDALCARYITPNERMYGSRKQDRKEMWAWASRHGVDAEAIAKTFEAKKPKPAPVKKVAAKTSAPKKAVAPVKKGARSKPNTVPNKSNRRAM